MALPHAERARAAKRRPSGSGATTSTRRRDSWSYVEADGTRLGQRVLPIDRVGLYVPGRQGGLSVVGADERDPGAGGGRARTGDGRADARRRRATRWCSPPPALPASTRSTPSAARTRWPRSPSAPASIRAVDKIVGPGNAYVALAKREVFGTVGIDMIAGPSEILVVSDGSVPADWVAMDLFSQAEHDEMAQAILISDDAAFLDAVAASIARQIEQMPRKAVIGQSLTRSRRADPGERPRAGGRAGQPGRAGAPGAGAARRAAAAANGSGTRARSSSAATPRNRWATIAPARAMCCPPCARRASRRRWACRTSRSARA